jgi:hypothetical protein
MKREGRCGQAHLTCPRLVKKIVAVACGVGLCGFCCGLLRFPRADDLLLVRHRICHCVRRCVLFTRGFVRVGMAFCVNRRKDDGCILLDKLKALREQRRIAVVKPDVVRLMLSST